MGLRAQALQAEASAKAWHRAQGSGHHPSPDKPGFGWQSRAHKEQSAESKIKG